jgi:hypothetical protein
LGRLVVPCPDLLDQLGELGEQGGELGQHQRDQNAGQWISPRHPLAQSLEDQGKSLGGTWELGWGGLHGWNI